MANTVTIRDVKIGSGDIVRVHQKVLEGDKERVQIFEGMVIGIRGRDPDKSFTVRKIAAGGIGVERIFQVNSPWVIKVDVKKPGQVRRAKLNYVREKSAKQVAQISTTQGE